MSSSNKSQQSKSKRKMIKALAAGGAVTAMPTEWVKPALQTAILPAHAQTTDDTGAAGSPTPPADGCFRADGWGWVFPESFSMSASGEFLLECNNTGGTVVVKNSSGATLDSMTFSGSQVDPISFSVSTSASVGLPSIGDVLTVIATQDGGCTCMTTFTLEDGSNN